ncbi:MAG TPA: phospholipase [Caldithrix sp.]|nr:phospholipase [Caldithrix sp.]
MRSNKTTNLAKQVKYFLLFLVFESGFCVTLFSQTTPVFQLVESVPVETTLGVSETARTRQMWLEMFRSARQSIDMEIFYLSHKKGEALQPVIDELMAAAKRGVKIRIIADAKMAKTYPETLERLNSLPNITVRRTDYFNRLGGVLHAKYFMVDGKELFLGSQNMDWRALTQIHELGARVRSPKLARLFGAIFRQDWKIAGDDNDQPVMVEMEFPPEVMINASNPLTFPGVSGDTLLLYPSFSPEILLPPVLCWDETELVKLINRAKKSIEIQLLSYKPVSRGKYYPVLEDALRRAAARGVRVHLIVSNWNTRQPGIQYLRSLQALPNVEVRISSIPQWSGGHIPFARVEHCKFMAVDNEWVWLGTANWAYSYFYTSRNVSLIIHSAAINQMVRKIFFKSWNSTYCKTLDLVKKYIPPDVAGRVGK